MRRARGAVLFALVSGLGCASSERVERVSPVWVHGQLAGGAPPAFACAYEAKECQGTHPAGCVTLEDLRARLPEMPKDHVIILCCG